jgi:UDP-N-acetyl-D-mannosaminuronic acid dehydrogenase
MKKMAVIGMGYVGIPVAALFADSGEFTVTGLQRRSPRSGWKLDFLNAGKSPFPNNEPGMADLLRRVVIEKKTLSVTDDFDILADMDVVLFDVQTPVDENHNPCYVSLKEVVRTTGRLMKRSALVCVESTVAPGTTRNVVRPILEEESGMEAGKDFYLAFSYERVMVGRLLNNIQNYPRVVGGLTNECSEKAVDLYRNIVQAPVVSTDCLTAEVSKTVENAYRDVNIAFANEVALMCESLGINVYKVRELVNNLPYDSSNPAANPVRNMHVPGAGVGGHCLPKDSWLLKYGVDKYGKVPVDSKMIVSARQINDFMPVHMTELAISALREADVKITDAKIGILGYAFLQNSDDTRNTPAKRVIEELRRLGVENISIHDPYVSNTEVPDVKRELSETVNGADCLCLVTNHDEYRIMDLGKLARTMRTPLLIDGRNLFEIDETSEMKIIKLGHGKST